MIHELITQFLRAIFNTNNVIFILCYSIITYIPIAIMYHFNISIRSSIKYIILLGLFFLILFSCLISFLFINSSGFDWFIAKSSILSFLGNKFQAHPFLFIYFLTFIFGVFLEWGERIFLGIIRNFIFSVFIIMLILASMKFSGSISFKEGFHLIPPFWLTISIIGMLVLSIIFRFTPIFGIYDILERLPESISQGIFFVILTYIDLLPIFLYMSYIKIHIV